jgi:hypothetical protein
MSCTILWRDSMRLIGLAATVAVAACGPTPATSFTGTYTGALSEGYTCQSSAPVSFVLSGQTLTITQSGSDVTVTLTSCSSIPIQGGVSGDVVNVAQSPQTTAVCTQMAPGGGQVSVADFSGGTLQLEGGNLEINLNEDATANGNTCTGTATGTFAKR